MRRGSLPACPLQGGGPHFGPGLPPAMLIAMDNNQKYTSLVSNDERSGNLSPDRY